MNVWYINSMLGTLRLEEEDDALCGVQLCPDGVPDLEPLPRKVCETPLLQETEEQLNEYFAGARREFCHCNPIAIIQPCHRVVGANGSLTGYAYGLEVKEYLLELEQD